MKPFRIVTLAATCALAGSLSAIASAQTVAPTDTSTPVTAEPSAAVAVPPTADDTTEASPVVATPPTPGPRVINWNFGRIAGHANLTMNPDGTYVFSGNAEARRGKDFDIALILKSKTGASLIFHYVGDANSGARWSKQGQSDILRDDWADFSGHSWTADYHFHENAAGRRAEYEARERRREEMQRMIDEAIKRHDEKVAAEKKAELKKQQEQEEAQAQAQQRAQP